MFLGISDFQARRTHPKAARCAQSCRLGTKRLASELNSVNAWRLTTVDYDVEFQRISTATRDLEMEREKRGRRRSESRFPYCFDRFSGKAFREAADFLPGLRKSARTCCHEGLFLRQPA